MTQYTGIGQRAAAKRAQHLPGCRIGVADRVPGLYPLARVGTSAAGKVSSPALGFSRTSPGSGGARAVEVAPVSVLPDRRTLTIEDPAVVDRGHLLDRRLGEQVTVVGVRQDVLLLDYFVDDVEGLDL